MPLKPINIVQVAEADLKRSLRNAARLLSPEDRKRYKHEPFEQLAFWRTHVRRADTARDLIMLALMDPTAARKTKKKNTKLIYGNGALLVQALKLIDDNEEHYGKFGAQGVEAMAHPSL